MDDEFEVEVTDLRTGQRVEQPAPAPTSASSQPAADEDGKTLDVEAGARPAAPAQASKPWLSQWASPRARGALVALSAVLLVGVVVLASVPNSRATLNTLLHVPTPTPTAALDPYAGTFFATQTAPWGVLFADGKPAQTVATQPGPWTLSFTLPRGRHTLEYRAAPFPTLMCVVSVPADPSDTCPLTTDTQLGPQVPVGERIVDMGVTLDRLPQDQWQMLVSAVELAVATTTKSTTGEVGDHYLATDGRVQVAQTAFQATLVYTLNQDANRVAPNVPPECATLCNLDGGGPDPTAWGVEAHVVVSWRYAFADGQTGDGPGLPGTPADILVGVDVSWNGAWLAALPDQGYLLCGLATAVVVGSNNASMRAGDDPNVADGCFVGLTTTDSNGTPVAGEAQLLYRFGAVLAVNAQAHQEFPALPLTSAHERALAQQMAQALGNP
jgi:hypothetical protein